MEKKTDNNQTGGLTKLYGGLPMTWPVVILYAIGAAMVTALFLIIPVFKGTSFARMGETFEAWIFFAVIIMANCKKPLESALKVFVFFLISQPLIYLFQVPFSWMGWKLFGYYFYWFLLTLATFPVAFIGWYINKKNWLSALIFLPVVCFLAFTAVGAFRDAFSAFPKYLLTGIFCCAQILIYGFVFFPKVPQRLTVILSPVIVAIMMVFMTNELDVTVYDSLPDAPVLSEEATLTIADDSIADVQITDPESAGLYIHAGKYGNTTIQIQDGDQTYMYALQVINDDGIARVILEKIE